MRILYVEDNPVDIDLTLRHLKKKASEMEVRIARSQTEALNILRNPEVSKYDLVLTDMNLGDGDGIAILSHIRGHSIPVSVVLLTGQGDEESAVSALKAGADDYIVKRSGYLENLPSLLENARVSYRRGEDRKVSKLKVLYVEHNPADIDLTERHLRKHAPHIHLTIISKVAQFHDLLDDSNRLSDYDVFLLDYRLPRENALEILKKLRSSPFLNVPVILITGKGDEEIAVKALKMGAFDYLTKDRGYLFKLPSVIENAYYNMRLTREHEALLESENRYRSLFENNHVVMLLVDPENGDIIDANPAAARFYGWSQTELKNRNVIDINTLSPDDIQKEMQAAVKQDRNYFIFKHRRSDGSIRDVEVYSGPIAVSGRSLLYSIVYDITQRIQYQREKEKLQAQLMQTQKMEAIGQLAGGIAHDFNNILASIIGYTELALDDVEKGSNAEDSLQEIYTAGIRATALVKQILAFARQSDEAVEPIKLGEIVEEALRFIRSSIPTSIRIEQNIDCDSMVMGNATRFHQILMNLCTNASQAMDADGGVLGVTLRNTFMDAGPFRDELNLKPGNHIELKVSDTGVGISPEIMGSIFEPYFTTKGPGEGTGMGLALTHGIVESCGGKIIADSEKGKGTVFTVYFPITDGCEDLGPLQEGDLPSGTERILFVDDESSIARMGAEILGRLGYAVTTSTSSEEALTIFRMDPGRFDLVITDMTMPKMTGDKLAQEMMNIRPDIPVILCTGYSKKVCHEDISKIGIRAFVYKPITRVDLARTVRKTLNQ